MVALQTFINWKKILAPNHRILIVGIGHKTIKSHVKVIFCTRQLRDSWWLKNLFIEIKFDGF